MWDKKGDNLTHKWLKLLKEQQEESQEELSTGERLGTEKLSGMPDEDIIKYAKARAAACKSMGYLSFGSKGEKVKELKKFFKQPETGVDNDVFDDQTLINVIKGQREKQIRVDGCVGPETLSTFGLNLSNFGIKRDKPEEPIEDLPSGQAEVEIAEYTGKITPSKIQRSLDKITSIVLHDALTSSLKGMIGYFSKPRTYTTKSGEEKTYYTGTHFSITADGKVRQHAPLAFPTNHTGTGGWNRKSVGIDIVTRAGGTGASYKGYVPPTPAQMEALYVLVSQLASKLPSLNKTVHWMSDAPRGGWKLGGKIFNIPSGIVSHGMVQGNRSDATFSSYYLKLRDEGMGHAEAFKKAIEDERAVRLGQKTMVAENSFKYGENLTYKFFRLLKEQQKKPVAIIAGDSQTGYSGKALESILKQNGYDVFRKYRGSWNEGENTKKTSKRLSNIDLGKPVNLVVVFTGGNNPSVEFSKAATKELIQTIRNNFGKDVEIVIGAAPPARTGNPQAIKKVFRKDSHSEGYKARRKEMANAIVSTANSMGVKAVDPHTAGFLAKDITTGDGVHLTGADAGKFAQAVGSQISGKGVGTVTATPSGASKETKSGRTFSGSRLSNSELRKMTAEEVVNYAKSRSSTCRNMGYLSIESKGKSVSDVQKALKDKGYEIKDADGEFGENTLISIIKFQIKSGIRVDGCVGPETMGRLGVSSGSEGGGKVFTTGGIEVAQDTVNVDGKDYKAVGSGENTSTKHIYVGRQARVGAPNTFLNRITNRSTYNMNEQEGDPTNLSMLDLINFVSKKMNIPPEVLLAVSWTETGANPRLVYSRSFDGSYGLTQVCRPVPEKDYDSLWRGHLTIYRRQFMRKPEKYGGFKPEYQYLNNKSYNQRRKVLYKVPGGGTVRGEAAEERYTRRRHPRSGTKPFRGCPDTFGAYWRKLETGRGVPQLDKEFMDKYMTKMRGEDLKTKGDRVKFMITDLMIGAAEMRRQLSRYNGDLRKAFPAYNAGSFRQNKEFSNLSQKTNSPIAFNENYQNKIISAYAWLREKAGKPINLVDIKGFDGDFKV